MENSRPSPSAAPKALLSPFLLRKTSKHIIPVASGKGGVGKTFFASNLGIQLAGMGKKTVVLDLDLGGSNLHTYLGLKNSDTGIYTYMNESDKVTMSKFLVKTPYSGLDIVPGDQLMPDAANFTNVQKRRIMEGIYTLPHEYIILDLGSGSSPAVTDFFLMSGKGILVSAPTHGAVLNAFSFLKTVIYRLFRLNFQDPKMRRIIANIKHKDDSGKFPTFWDVLNELGNVNKKLAITFKKTLDSYKPAVMFNMIESTEDIELIRQLISLIYNKLILDLDMLGFISSTAEAHESIKKRKPLLSTDTTNRVSLQIAAMADKLTGCFELRKSMFDLEKYDTSVEEIEDQIRQSPEFKKYLPPPAAKSAMTPPGNPFDVLRQKADDIGRNFMDGFRGDPQK